MNKLMLLFSFVVLVGGCISSDDTKSQVTGSVTQYQNDQSAGLGTSWSLFESSDYGFSIEYPSNWLKKKLFSGKVLSFLSLQDDAANFNIVLENLSNNPIALEDYTILTINSLKSLFSNVTYLGETTLGDFPAHSITYRSENEVYNLKFLVVYTIRNNIAYVVTFTVQEDAYNSYLGVMQEIFDSFEIL